MGILIRGNASGLVSGWYGLAEKFCLDEALIFLLNIVTLCSDKNCLDLHCFFTDVSLCVFTDYTVHFAVTLWSRSKLWRKELCKLFLQLWLQLSYSVLKRRYKSTGCSTVQHSYHTCSLMGQCSSPRSCLLWPLFYATSPLHSSTSCPMEGCRFYQSCSRQMEEEFCVHALSPYYMI